MDLAIDQRGLGNRWSLASGVAGFGLSPVTHLAAGETALRQRRAGRIVTQAGQLQAVYGRRWPHLGSLLQMFWDQQLRPLRTDRCELYYHRPWTAPGFLTLAYVRSGPRTSLATFYAATLVLDEIARLQGIQALVCHVTNTRISDRLLDRWGWQAHCPHLPGRHFIKRFYGVYPPLPALWAQRLSPTQAH